MSAREHKKSLVWPCERTEWRETSASLLERLQVDYHVLTDICAARKAGDREKHISIASKVMLGPADT